MFIMRHFIKQKFNIAGKENLTKIIKILILLMALIKIFYLVQQYP